MAEDARHRGELWFTPDQPHTDESIAREILRVDLDTWNEIKARVTVLGLFSFNEDLGVYYFPDYAKHQHDAGLRKARNRREIGAKPARNGRSSRARASEAEAETEGERGVPPTPAVEPVREPDPITPETTIETATRTLANNVYHGLVKTKRTRIDMAEWRQAIGVALNAGVNAGDIEAAIMQAKAPAYPSNTISPLVRTAQQAGIAAERKAEERLTARRRGEASRADAKAVKEKQRAFDARKNDVTARFNALSDGEREAILSRIEEPKMVTRQTHPWWACVIDQVEAAMAGLAPSSLGGKESGELQRKGAKTQSREEEVTA